MHITSENYWDVGIIDPLNNYVLIKHSLLYAIDSTALYFNYMNNAFPISNLISNCIKSSYLAHTSQ